MSTTQPLKYTIPTSLRFDEKAVDFYTAIFPGSRSGRVVRSNKVADNQPPMPEWSMQTVKFTINGQDNRSLPEERKCNFTDLIHA